MKPTFVLHDHKFAAIARKWSKVFQKSVGELLRDRAGMLGRYMAASTQPAIVSPGKSPPGGRPAERKLGENAIRGDIAKTVDADSWLTPKPARGVSTRLVLRYSAARKKKLSAGGKASQAEKVYLVDRDIWKSDIESVAAFHNKQRTHRGRVGRAGTYGQKQGRWKARDRVVTKPAVKSKLLKKQMAKVGLAKGAWINAARVISSTGLSNVPRWLENSAPGQATARLTGNQPFIRLKSKLDYASDALRPEYEAAAIDGFMKSLKKDMLAQLRHKLNAAK